MTEPIKVLHVFGRLVRAGAQLRTLDCVRYLGSEAFDTHFCSLSDAAADLARDIETGGFALHVLPIRERRFRPRFAQFLERERFDVVHAHVHYLSGYVLQLAAAKGVACRIAHFRSTADGHRPTPWRWLRERLLRRAIDRHAHAILAVSASAMTACWGRRWQEDGRCRVIYNGIDPQSFRDHPGKTEVGKELGLPPEAPWVIHVGRIVRPKNHGRVLSVFAELSRRMPQSRLLLVGWDAANGEAELRLRAEQLSIAQRVTFLGARRDVPRLLAAADVMLFPSLWEGFPGAVLESAAAGTPVLASDLESLRELARPLRGIELLSLQAADDVWADSLHQAIVCGSRKDWRQQVKASFAASAFTVSQSAGQLARIWQGAAHG